MAHYLTNNEKFHIFSKSPVLSSMAVSQAVNKSGHTVSTNDVWADDVPWFTEVADEAGAITRAADARYNDLILWGSDIYVRKGDKTNGASTGTTFAELWEKHTDLTEARAYALGSVTTQTPTNIVTKTVELKNASDKVVLKYHVGKQIDLLTTANNANVASTWAARMFIDGKVVDQFVSPTDKVFAGNPSTGYTTLVYTATAAGNKYGFVAEGEADGDFVNNAFAGIVQFNQSRNDTHKFAASVFEYVGDKLDSTVAKLSAAVFGSGGGSPDDQPTDLVTQVNQNTAALTTLNGDVSTNGSIAQKIDTAINGLGDVAVKSDITITDIKVQQGSGEAESLTITDKSVTIEIPEVPAADVTEDGVVTTDGFTKTADVTNLAKAAINAAITSTDGAIADAIDGAISDATLGDGEKIATTTDTTKLVTVEDVTTYVSENAKVTLTQGTGITVTPNGEASTSFTVAVDDTVATKQSVDDLSSLVSGLPATIQAAQDAADDAMEEAQKKVASITTGTVPDGVTITTGTTPQLSIETAQGGKIWSDANKLVTQMTAEAIASSYADGVASDIKGQTLAQTGTLSGMFTVQTAGTVGTGITGITITDAGLAKAISDAASAADTLSSTSVNYSTSLGVDADTVTVALGGTVGTPSIQITNVAAASALATLESKVNAYHEAGISYKVHDSQTLPDLSVAENVEKYKNVILLVPSTTSPDLDETNAITGGYVEWLCVKTGETTYAWEQIGTTEANLHGYVSQIAGPNTQSGTSSVYASISSTGYLSIGAKHATDSVFGVSKMFTGDLTTTASTVTDTAVSVKSAQAMYISLASDKVSAVVADDYLSLAGISVATQGTHVAIKNTFVTKPSLMNSITSVVNGVITSQSSVEEFRKMPIETSKIVNGTEMFNKQTSMTTWVDDLECMTSGYEMFADCSNLTTFIGDLSSVTDGGRMFYSCTNLTTFCGDLSSLTSGDYMFYNCKLDAESLECIAETLPTVPSGMIEIGYNCPAADAQAAYDTITGKGWSCTMTYNA